MKRRKPLRRTKALGAVVETHPQPDPLQALLLRDRRLSVGDAVDFRAGPFGRRGPWLPGTVVGERRDPKPYRVLVQHEAGPGAPPGSLYEVSPRQIRPSDRVPDQGSEPDPPRDGLPPISGPIVVRTGGKARAVPKPRRRYRDGEYLDFVREHPCLYRGDAAEPAWLPAEAHHAGERGVSQKADDYDAVPLATDVHRHVTDHNTLPGLTPLQTEIVILRAKVALLKGFIAHHEQEDREAEGPAERLAPVLRGMPRLAAVGALLLVLLCSGAVYAAPPARPASAELLIVRGRVALQDGRAGEAEILARTALSRRRRPLATAYVLLGDALATQGRCPAARTEYLRALAVAPGNHSAEEGLRACAGDLPQRPPPVAAHPKPGPAAPAPPRRIAQGGRP